MPVLGRRRRLAEELEECGLPLGSGDEAEMLLDEIDYAQRPPVHERRIPTTGAVLAPKADPEVWDAGTGLQISRMWLDSQPLDSARRFADGKSTWVVRWMDGCAEWLLFNRPSGSERDLVVLADRLQATVVQRSSMGVVRVVGSFGVFRWDGLQWRHEPPLHSWIDAVALCPPPCDPRVLKAIIEFAVHDLGAAGIGSLLIYRPNDGSTPPVEHRLPSPPALSIRNAAHLAPLRHALAQLDGAAFFDTEGVLRHLGVRLVPSQDAELHVDGLGGTRHTSARRYSYDDPLAAVIVVSEDGPVSVISRGEVLSSSPL